MSSVYPSNINTIRLGDLTREINRLVEDRNGAIAATKRLGKSIVIVLGEQRS
ncbi:MAG: hypothetical protein HC840_18000 [Leptolyngbyaceae cyanobacterium RM2_2_4]|nr:hypothetical protein [Leptolyngbyaceae cyanobacterium SM1_4_3]NJO51022.1 hypothetical protein [Leptolyngbyaceae cyanobacterium RM2_2_4]